MTISDGKKFIFVEVGSSASTAIRNVLNKYRDVKVSVIDGFNFNRDQEDNPSHIPIWALNNKLDIHEFYKFAFFRNPWEVAVSKFFFHNGTDVVKSHMFPKDKRTHNICSCEFNDWISRAGFLDMHYESKTKTMWDFVAKGDTILVDDIFDFKLLDKNWEIASNKMNIPHEILINNKNNQSNAVCGKTKKGHYSKYYTDKTVELVREHFAREIEYFGYQFEDER